MSGAADLPAPDIETHSNRKSTRGAVVRVLAIRVQALQLVAGFRLVEAMLQPPVAELLWL